MRRRAVDKIYASRITRIFRNMQLAVFASLLLALPLQVLAALLLSLPMMFLFSPCFWCVGRRCDHVCFVVAHLS